MVVAIITLSIVAGVLVMLAWRALSDVLKVLDADD